MKKTTMKTYRNISEKTINVNAIARQPKSEFQEEETRELKNLCKHKYLEIIKVGEDK